MTALRRPVAPSAADLSIGEVAQLVLGALRTRRSQFDAGLRGVGSPVVLRDELTLAARCKDRTVRRAIEELRVKGYPVVSSGDHAGYSLSSDPEEIEECIQREFLPRMRAHAEVARGAEASEADGGKPAGAAGDVGRGVVSAETEILLVLVGDEGDVIERLEGVSDQPMLVALHLAERKGRRRKKVLEAIEARGIELELAPVSVAAAHLQNEIVSAVAKMAVSRPTALPLDRSLNPEDEYPTPLDGAFEDDATGRVFDYMRAPDLSELGYEVLGDYADHLQPALDFGIGFMWKRKGGESGGNSTLGKCVKVSGLASFYAEHQYLIWVAADHAREFRLTRHQMEALLFHELKHVDRTETYAPTTKGHEVEMFIDEVRIFGPWKADLERMVRQLALPIGGAK